MSFKSNSKIMESVGYEIMNGAASVLWRDSLCRRKTDSGHVSIVRQTVL